VRGGCQGKGSTCSFANSYRLRLPRDNISTCTVPSGYTYDLVTSRLNTCSPNNFANSYRLS